MQKTLKSKTTDTGVTPVSVVLLFNVFCIGVLLS